MEERKREPICEHILAEVGPRCSVLIISLSLSCWMAVSDLPDCLSDHIFWSDSDIAIHF